MEIFEWEENIPVTAENLNEMQNTINNNITEFTTPTVLWTNPNPNNNFSSSQITLSSEDYNFLEIYYYDWTGEQLAWKDLMCQKTLKGYGTKLIMQLKYDSKSYAANRRIRYINNTTLAVDDCYATIEENAFTNNVRNNWCVPVKILGYK